MKQNLVFGKISTTLLVTATIIISGCSAPTLRSNLRTEVTTVPRTSKSWANAELLRTIDTEGFSIAVGPDSRTLARGAEAKVEIWDLITGELQRTIPAKYTIRTSTGGSIVNADVVSSVIISPDGQTLVSKIGDEAVQVNEMRTGKLIHRFLETRSEKFMSIAISPDGQTLISGDQHGTLKTWNLLSGELLQSIKQDSKSIQSIAISPDGENFASSASDATIKLRNLKTFKLISVCEWPVMSGETSDIGDGKAINSYWSVKGSATSVAISSNNQFLVAGGSSGIVIWNLSIQEPLFILTKNEDKTFDSVTISPDNQTLISTIHDASSISRSYPMKRTTTTIWDLKTRMALGTTIHVSKDYENYVAFSPNGQFLVTDEGKKIKVWHTSP